MDEVEARAFIGNRFQDLEDGPSEWWKQDGKDTCLELFDQLTGLGVPPGTAAEVLSGAFWAAASEYGD